MCGWDEVFILALGGGPAPAHRKVWSWRAADSPEIPADMHARVSHHRRLQAGRWRPQDPHSVVWRRRGPGRSGTLHAPLFWPASPMHTPSNCCRADDRGRRVGIDGGDRQPSGDFRRRHRQGSSRATSCDPGMARCGTTSDGCCGHSAATCCVGTASARPGGPTRLERTFEIALPNEGGHDLVAIPDSPRLFVSTVRNCFVFDRERRQFAPHEALGDHRNIKSYAMHPRTGRVVYIQAESPNWWAEHLHFQRPDGTLRLSGEHLPKARSV